MRYQLTPMVRNLLLINAAIFLLNEFIPGINGFLSLKSFSSDAFLPTQFLTSMFVHYGFMHLFGNMLSLYMFGTVLENVWGSKKFLVFYVICGVGAALIYSAIHSYETNRLKSIYYSYSETPTYESLNAFEKQFGREIFTESAKENAENPTVAPSIKNEMEEVIAISIHTGMGGASGAVFGILMAFALLFPNTELIMMFIPVPIKAKYFIMIYAFMELTLGVVKLPGDNVAHFAHLGGALFGFILVKYWQKQRNTFY